MSARSVCSGTRPSRYHSMRAISAPPRRPEQLIRMPSAPRRIADCTARFMARRNATRRSSCCAIDSATSVASSSGLRISTMLMTTSEAVISATRLRSLSMSAPFLPITTPGRAEWIVPRHFLCGLSMTIFEIAACLRFFMSVARIAMSSCRSFPYSVRPANQRESQVRLTPSRRPIGLTFCPIAFSLRPRGGRTGFPNNDRQMRERLTNAPGASPRARAKPLQDHRVADVGRGDDQIVDIEIVVILGVGDRALEGLLDIEGAPLAGKLEIGESLLNLLAADQLRQKIQLLRADPQHPGDRLGFIVLQRARRFLLGHDQSLSASFGFFVPGVTVKGPGRGKLTEFMADHVFGHGDRHMLVAVINREREPDELRQYGRPATPNLDDFGAA